MASATGSEPRSAPPAGDRGRLLVFVHIPKAAGTTFGRILRHHYGAHFERIDQFRREDLERAAARGEPVSVELPGVQAVTGHVAFGLLERLFPDALFVTILRDPVERTLSQYEYMLHRVGRPWHHETLPAPTADLTIDEALGRGYVRDNLQTRMLCGLISPTEALPPDALKQAKRNLAEQFAHVGTTARFAEFLALLNLEFGWPTVAYKEGRVTPGRRPAADRTADELRAVEDANAFDREVFAHAEELLARALAGAGPEVAAEADVLRRALPIERRARGGETVPDPEAVRALPVEARVALALKEAELGRVGEVARLKLRKLVRAKKTSTQRAERIRELKRALRTRSD
jgi:hypothetical protein